jgi:hypothetical protein
MIKQPKLFQKQSTSYQLPVIQQDVLKIDLFDHNLAGALQTLTQLVDLSSPRYLHPVLASQIINLLPDSTLEDTIQFVKLYGLFLKAHGTIVLRHVWTSNAGGSTFWTYIAPIWNRLCASEPLALTKQEQVEEWISRRCRDIQISQFFLSCLDDDLERCIGDQSTEMVFSAALFWSLPSAKLPFQFKTAINMLKKLLQLRENIPLAAEWLDMVFLCNGSLEGLLLRDFYRCKSSFKRCMCHYQIYLQKPLIILFRYESRNTDAAD